MEIMHEDREFYSLHLPHLISYVVPVVQLKNGRLEIGSGVLVRASGRHFIATAKHCIDGKVRAMQRIDPQHETARELEVLQKGWHDTLDLGFLEVGDPECAELGWDQLCNDRIVGGSVQFVGYPEVLTQSIERQPGKLTDVSLCAGTFGTTLIEDSADRMTFEYPRIGSKYDEATGEWLESPFPATPRGFSGGACFGVAKSTGLIGRVEYKLLAIQYAWNERRRVVLATPIKRWCDLLVERGLVTQPSTSGIA